MPILGLQFQSGLLLATSSLCSKYEEAIWQSPLQLSEDVFCVCAVHPELSEQLRMFIENVRMSCNHLHLRPCLVAKQVQRNLLLHRELGSYIQFIIGGVDRINQGTTLFSVINGVLLEYTTYCVGAYEARCSKIQGYIDAQYRADLPKRDAVSLAHSILTVASKNVIIDMVVIQLTPDTVVKRLSFYKDEATKYKIDLEYRRERRKSGKKSAGGFGDSFSSEYGSDSFHSSQCSNSMSDSFRSSQCSNSFCLSDSITSCGCSSSFYSSE